MIHHPVLRQLADNGIRLGLDEVQSFLHSLGEPHRAYPVVHVAGTNGKGSVSTMVTAALVDAGYSVGTNNSPHLEAVNERVRIDGVPIDDTTLTMAIESLDRARTDWARLRSRKDIPLTYFEFLTCVAFQVFAERAVNAAVIEVGLGGRLDATNVVHPVVTAITSIGLDHVDQLGGTLASVATEKAGIIKPGIPVIVGSMPAEARSTIEAVAEQRHAPIWLPGRHLSREHSRRGWNLSTPDGQIQGLKLAMEGEHQGANAMVALGVLHGLRRSGFAISDDAIVSGLSRAVIPGRLENIAPGLWVDGAHNEDATKALARWLAARPPVRNRILLFGMGSERDPRKVLAPLAPHVNEVVATHCAHPKARQSYELAAVLQEMDIVLADGGPIEEALPDVYQDADEIIVAGSLFVAGAATSIARAGALDALTLGSRLDEDEADQ